MTRCAQGALLLTLLGLVSPAAADGPAWQYKVVDQIRPGQRAKVILSSANGAHAPRAGVEGGGPPPPTRQGGPVCSCSQIDARSATERDPSASSSQLG